MTGEREPLGDELLEEIRTAAAKDAPHSHRYILIHELDRAREHIASLQAECERERWRSLRAEDALAEAERRGFEAAREAALHEIDVAIVGANDVEADALGEARTAIAKLEPVPAEPTSPGEDGGGG